MFLSPRRFVEKFLVEEKRTRLDEFGNQRVTFEPAGDLSGIISSVNPQERERYKGLKHVVAHKIVQHLGTARARIGDRLIKADKIYFVEDINDVSNLGLFYIYYVSERSDVK